MGGIVPSLNFVGNGKNSAWAAGGGGRGWRVGGCGVGGGVNAFGRSAPRTIHMETLAGRRLLMKPGLETVLEAMALYTGASSKHAWFSAGALLGCRERPRLAVRLRENLTMHVRIEPKP